MVQNRTEAKWFIGTVLFALLYCGFLFWFRTVLMQLETGGSSVLKPEVSQIFIIGFLIIFYHFAFLGIDSFSKTGQWQKAVAGFIAFLFNGGLLYGFKLWYDAIANNPFLFLGQTQKLPWYAEERTKFIIANAPLILFFTTVLVLRLIIIYQKHSIHIRAEKVRQQH